MSGSSGWSGLRAVAFGLTHYDTPVARHVARLLESGQPGAVLEIGCGPGALLRRLGHDCTRPAVTGIDPSGPLVAMARWRTRRLSGVSVDRGRAEDLPYPESSFDLAVAVHSTHHWDDTDRGLAETARVLRPDGELVVVERGPDGTWGITDANLDQLTDAIRRAGLVAVHVDRHRVGRGTEVCISAVRPDTTTRLQEPR